MTIVNRLLLISCAAVLGSHTFLSRGLDHDGSHNLFHMIAEKAIYNVELSRKIFDFFYQLPAYLLIKFSPFSSLSILTIFHSFGLIWIHIISIIGCFFILPKGRKNLLFFPLFAFLTGPVTGLGISVSVGLSVCSYIWFVAFVLYYSDLSLLRHRLLFFLVPFPLLFSHELTSYMALPLIALCLRKYQKESVLFHKLLIQITTGVLVLSSFLAFLLFFIHDTTFDNRDSFVTSLTNLEFIYSQNGFNFPVIISFVLIIFLFLSILSYSGKTLLWFGIREKKDGFKNLFFRNLSSFIAWALEKVPIALFLLISFFSCFFSFFWFFKVPMEFPMEDDYYTRVWPLCFALPLNFLFWWLFKERIKGFHFRKYPWFLLSLVVVGVTFTSWRLRSDWLFYRHRVEFSEVLSRFQGIQEWGSVQSAFSEIIFNRKIDLWQITPASLIYPASRTVTTVLVWPHSDCMNYCMTEGKQDSDISYQCNSFCDKMAFSSNGKWLTDFSKSRFFDFSNLKYP